MISTKGRYALRMMVDIAKHGTNECVSLRQISKRQNISIKYLEQLVPFLLSANLLSSIRGAHGGYKLKKNPESITCKDIIFATEDHIAPANCLDENMTCPNIAKCDTYQFWSGLNDVMVNYMQNTTLKDLIA